MIKEKLITKALKRVPDHGEIREMAKTYKNSGGCCFIIDDAFEALMGEDLCTLFCQSVHHLSLSCIIVTQTLFNTRSKSMRTLSLNTQYLVVFKFNRDVSQIMALGHQVSPHRPSFLIKSYLEATEDNFAYLFIDFSARQRPEVRYRSRIFPDEAPMIVFLQRSNNK